MRKILLILLVFSVMSFPLAFAHPFTGETIPAKFSSAPTGTSEVIVFYSEGVEIEFSRLQVFDSNGDQADNKDTKYYEGDYSLVVTTPPLEDGAYTVTSKVLSKVDGHLVPDAFVFGVGDIVIDPTQFEDPSTAELIFYPEAGARFPGLVGQTIVLGAVIASVLIWSTQKIDFIKDDVKKLQSVFQSKFMSLVGFGLIVVFASNILMLTVQAFRLETSAIEALQTSFGMTWIIRMAITIALLGLWFVMEKIKNLSIKKQIPLLVLSLALIATTTMMGHGAASEQASAIALDYVHNLVSAVWIGGIIFFAFTLLPAYRSLKEVDREKLALATIPKFSIMFIIALGIVIVSGPTLMWLLETDVGIIVESTYGKLIIAKILIASAMVAIGGYHQFGIQKKAESKINSGKISINKKLKRTLKVEAGLGILLLAVVALLTNGTLPAGEIQKVDAQQIVFGLATLEFAESTKFDIQIKPFTTGNNALKVKVTDFEGNPVSDLGGFEVKVSNPSRNITPIVVPMESVDDSEEEIPTEFKGEITFPFSGTWQVELEAQKTESANDSVILDLLVKPRLSDLKAEITEFEFPEEGAPLYPIYDGDDTIWISDSSAPRIWKYSIEKSEFTKYEFDGQASITLTMDNDGKIWFTDIPEGRIGYVDPSNGDSKTIEFPDIVPATARNYPITLDVDNENNIWVSIANKNVIMKYDQNTSEFEEIRLPTSDSGPFSVVVGPSGKIWFTQQTAGQIGFIDTESEEVTEITPPTPLATPETLSFDDDGNIWIAEHQEGGAITKFNPILRTFERIAAPDTAAFPNSAVFDRYENIWFAQHTVDKIAAYDPQRGTIMEFPIPTGQSWVQFMLTDNDDNIWFVEQQPYKLGMIKLTETPNLAPIPVEEASVSIRYGELAGPLMSGGIIATSLFLVKSVRDKRRINAFLDSQ